MSQEWERNLSSIVKETETNLARVRDRLDGSEYKSFSSGLHPISNGGAKYSTPTKPLPSSMSGFTGNTYDTYHTTGYRGVLSHNAWQDDYGGNDNTAAVSDHTPALVAMLSEKIETQNKIIEDLIRQVKSQERDREQMTSRLRNMEREMMAVSRRLEESGVHLETERKMERAQQELRVQLSELQNQVHIQRQNGMTESVYSDDVLSTLSRELHDFKRQTQEECDSLHRGVESLRTRMIKAEVEVSGQQADSREVNRRLDRLDRTVTSVSDSQRIQCKDINQSLRQKNSHDRELDHLRTDMGKLMHTVDRLEHDNATNHKYPTSHLMTAGEAASLVHSTQPKTEFKPKKRTHRKDRTHAKLRPLSGGVITLDSSSDDDINNLDVSTTLSLDSSSSDDSALVQYKGSGQLNAKKVVASGEDVNDLLSDLDDNLEEKDEPLDVAELTDTPSISSIELDSDLL